MYCQDFWLLLHLFWLLLHLIATFPSLSAWKCQHTYMPVIS